MFNFYILMISQLHASFLFTYCNGEAAPNPSESEASTTRKRCIWASKHFVIRSLRGEFCAWH